MSLALLGRASAPDDVGPARPPVPLPLLLDIAHGLASAHNVPPTPPDVPTSARSSTRLLDTETYQAWLLTWPAGSGIDPHDHGDAHGAFVVVSGELSETRWTPTGVRRRPLPAGAGSTVPVGAVHGLRSTGGERAVSVHVYSPPLTEMRFYDGDVGGVVAVETVEPAPEGTSRS